MKLKQWIPVILMSSCLLALSACTTTRHYTEVDSTPIKRSTSSSGKVHHAKTSGLGDDDSRFEREDKDEGREKVSLNDKKTYYFDFDSNVVHDADKPAIAENSANLVTNPKHKVMLEGHTDPRGSREYNIGLGERRAQAVANIMKDKGVDPEQIRIVSYGAQKLASTERTEAGYQLDRRAVIVNSHG